MRSARLAGLCAGAAALTACAVPGVAAADSDHTIEPLTVGVDVAAQVQADLGRPASLPLCGLDRRPVVVIDRHAATRALFCVEPDVAADLAARAHVR